MNRSTDVFPPAWASAYGDDAYGLWAELTYGNATQRLRWIEPGTFLMGSGDGLDASATGVETPQHPVTLTRGYWLADTPCTQAFWLAVVADNPSRFADDVNCPVEQVSFEDIRTRFLPILQAALGDAAQAQLPSEAQWEYACRAGTLTSFAYGETVTSRQANCGNFSLEARTTKQSGHIRHRTMRVGRLPPNRWGLFDMHGNVWEWCRDGQRPYAATAAVDPEGPPDYSRVVRGGSWFYDAQNARSATRSSELVSGSGSDLGFRWTLS